MQINKQQKTSILKRQQVFFFVVFAIIFCHSGKSQTETIGTINEVTTVGYFDGEIINKYGYKINGYYISISDLSDSQIEVFKKKMIKISGKLYIPPNDNPNGFQSSNEVIKYIKQPKIVLYQESDTNYQHNYSVKIVGAMRNVMHKGELFGTISLDTISNKNHLFGLGPVEYLKGEIMILDGKAYRSTVADSGNILMEETWQIKAPFFVYANVEKWKEITFPDSVQTIPQLEIFLDNFSKDLPRPFPFKITATVENGEIHIVNLPEGTEVHSPEEAHQNQQSYRLENEQGEMIGFFSSEHQGVFTHHDSYVHLHFISTDKKKMGHLDEALFKKGAIKFFLPE